MCGYLFIYLFFLFFLFLDLFNINTEDKLLNQFHCNTCDNDTKEFSFCLCNCFFFFILAVNKIICPLEYALVDSQRIEAEVTVRAFISRKRWIFDYINSSNLELCKR